MPHLRLTYFDSPGRAEPVRIVLRMGGVPFEDRRLAFREFMALKAEGAFPLGSVPVLEVDGLAITQTAAMLRFAARLGAPDLLPADPVAALVVDSALDTFNDTGCDPWPGHEVAPATGGAANARWSVGVRSG